MGLGEVLRLVRIHSFQFAQYTLVLVSLSLGWDRVLIKLVYSIVFKSIMLVSASPGDHFHSGLYTGYIAFPMPRLPERGELGSHLVVLMFFSLPCLLSVNKHLYVESHHHISLCMDFLHLHPISKTQFPEPVLVQDLHLKLSTWEENLRTGNMELFLFRFLSTSIFQTRHQLASTGCKCQPDPG